MASDGCLRTELSLEEFGRFRDYVHQHSGIFLEDAKVDSLRISLVTRATRLGLDSFEEYFEHLASSETEFKALMNLVTINETSFFRFPQQFEALRTYVIPEILEGKRQGAHSFRAWSAGCSTGEEPYSIAITLVDTGIERLGWKPQVFGSDVSTDALKVAETAKYPAKALASVAADVVARYFDRVPDGYRVNRATRQLTAFGYQNLIKEPYPLALMGDWDVVFCRNVTIYFKLESTRRVIANIFRSMNDGGYLFLGHSETLTNLSDDFEPVEVNGVFLYRKPRRTPSVWAGMPLIEPRAEAAYGSRRSAETRKPRIPRADAGSESAASGPAERGDAHQGAGGPSTAEELISAARAASVEGRPQDVLGSVGALLETQPENAEAYLLAAYAHADAGAYGDALEECQRALAINPLMPAARYILGIIYHRQGNLVRAVGEFKKTIYIDPEFALAHLNLGNIHRSQRKWDAARREYENALRALYKNPEGEWSHFMGGFKADLLVKTCERSLLECRRATGSA